MDKLLFNLVRGQEKMAAVYQCSDNQAISIILANVADFYYLLADLI